MSNNILKIILFDQVLWLGKEYCNVTWELQESIPQHLIDEFMSGAQPVACDNTVTSGVGGVLHTLTVRHDQQSLPNSHQRPVVKDNDG